MSAQTRTLAATIAVGAALFVALWLLAIAPRREERTKVQGTLQAQQARLAATKGRLAAYGAARERFPGLLAELRRLDRAVPARGNIAALLRELQRRARVRDAELRLVALRDPQQATAGAAPSTTPGAVTGPGGLAALPFTFEYTGRYFDLLDILRTVRRSVRVSSGDLRVHGRLLTIDGLAFKPSEGDVRLTKAVLNATAYIAPDQAAVPPAAGAKGGS